MSAPVTVSSSLEAGPVCQEPVLVVDGDLGQGVLTASQYHQLLQLYAAGRPDVRYYQTDQSVEFSPFLLLLTLYYT